MLPVPPTASDNVTGCPVRFYLSQGVACVQKAHLSPETLLRLSRLHLVHTCLEMLNDMWPLYFCQLTRILIVYILYSLYICRFFFQESVELIGPLRVEP